MSEDQGNQSAESRQQISSGFESDLDSRLQKASAAYERLFSRQANCRALLPLVDVALVVSLTWLLSSQKTWEDTVRKVFEGIPQIVESLGIIFPVSIALLSWLLVLGITVPIYYWLVEVPVKRQQREVEALKDEVRANALSNHSDYIEKEYQRLCIKTESAFLDNSNRYDIAERSLRKVKSNLGHPEQAVMALSDLEKVNALILREERELREQRSSRDAGIVVMAVYAILLVVIVLVFRRQAGSALTPIPLIYVPPSIVAWSAMGSLAAMLLHFQKPAARVSLAKEIRWLIARPVLGILMGCLTFIALMCGLLILTPMDAGGMLLSYDKLMTAKPLELIVELGPFWVVAFLAGFSDRFYEGVINKLLGKIERPETSVEEASGKARPVAEASQQ